MSDSKNDATTPTSVVNVAQLTRRAFVVAGGVALTTKVVAGGRIPAPAAPARRDVSIVRYDKPGREGALIAGSGEPLILVHGIGSTASVWLDIIPNLARHFRVLAVTLPGHVGGPTQPSGAQLRDHVDFVIDIVENDVEFKGAHVAGFSIGGSIALEVARATAIGSACAIGPGNHTYAASLQAANANISARLAQARAQRDTLLNAAEDPEIRKSELALIAQHGDRVPPDAFVAFVNNQLDCTVMEPLLADTAAFAPLPSTPPCSITLVWGDHDLLFPNDPDASVARKNVPGAVYIEVPDSGHVTLIDQPALTADVIRFTARR